MAHPSWVFELVGYLPIRSESLFGTLGRKYHSCSFMNRFDRCQLLNINAECQDLPHGRWAIYTQWLEAGGGFEGGTSDPTARRVLPEQ